MPSANGASWNNKRLREVTDALQIREHFVESHTDVPSNIFSNNPSGPHCFDNIEHCWPEVAVIRRASALPGAGKGLTRIASGKEPNISDCRKVGLSDVSEVGDAGPVLSQHG
jgi:hypothetical protein